MNSRFAPAVFLAAFCCSYVLVFALDWPLFRYYPLKGRFNWGAANLPDIGPGMAWYGLLASAGLIATLAALLLPDRLLQRALSNRLWLFPVAAMLACVFLLRQFFQ